MNDQPAPDARPNTLHRRLTVALAAAPERQDLMRALLGEPDETAPSPLLAAADLWAAAERLAEARADDRRDLLQRLESAASRTMHDRDTAASKLESLVTWQRTLREGHQWADGLVSDLDGPLAAVDQARAVLDASSNDHKEARHRLERVLEQRAAAAQAIEDASRELGDMAPAGMDESGLRRELESAGRAVQDAREAHRAAEEHLATLEAEAAELAERRAALTGVVDPAQAGPSLAALTEVREALDALQSASMLAGVDRQADALADAWTDLSADLAEHAGTQPQQVTEADLAAARQRVDEAAAALAEVAANQQTRLSPGARAAIEDAHAAVLEAEERTGRRVGAGAARQRLAEAQAAEQALLDQHGFATYLDVVLSGGRAGTDNPGRLAAERSHLGAVKALQALEPASQATPERAYLESERDRLAAAIVELLGVDPGDRTVEMLRAHRTVPQSVLLELVSALAAAGVVPIGKSAEDAAVELLERHATSFAAGEQSQRDAGNRQVELSAIDARQAALEQDVPAARSEVDRTAEALHMAERSVAAFESELTVRAGEDMARMQRFAAAEQLRAQVEAVNASLAKAEAEAKTTLEEAGEAVAAAETSYDRATEALGDLARRARQLAEELPIDDRPEGEPLSTLAELAAALVRHAEVLQPEIDVAEAAFTEAAAQMDDAEAAVRLAASGAEGPQADDLVEGLTGLLDAAAGLELLVLDDPFETVDAGVRPSLLDVVVAASEKTQVALLTEDPDALGWAIELPIDVAMVVPAEALLARLSRTAPTETPAGGAVDLSRPDPHP
ncbi:MAG: hypothetical protein ACSLFP_12120, partial [Acidimicrobiales bacterium]